MPSKEAGMIHFKIAKATSKPLTIMIPEPPDGACSTGCTCIRLDEDLGWFCLEKLGKRQGRNIKPGPGCPWHAEPATDKPLTVTKPLTIEIWEPDEDGNCSVNCKVAYEVDDITFERICILDFSVTGKGYKEIKPGPGCPQYKDE